jgi:hypothetical protein
MRQVTNFMEFFPCVMYSNNKVNKTFILLFDCIGRRMEKISWTDRVRKDEVLHRVKEERNILQTIKTRKATWIGNIWCSNCLLERISEGKIDGSIEVKGRIGRKLKQLPGDLKEKRV